MSKYIIDYLKSYSSKKSTRFHMPGHKGKSLLDELTKDIVRMDITEIEGSDDLHFPSGIIKKSEEQAAEVFGARETLFMVNGSTGAIHSAITGILRPREKILIQRDSHKSAYNAIMLGDLIAEYVYSEYDEEKNIKLGVTPESVADALEKDDEIKAVFLTYPSYYGVCSDIKKIAEIVHSKGKILIVDEAHGSHLKFSSRLPKSSIDLGADIVIQSTHKTLLGFTQSSMLHICSGRVDPDDIRRMARVYQSTSPSYLLMASLELTVDYLVREGRERLDNHLNDVERLISDVKESNLNLITREYMKKKGYDFDITKIVFGLAGMSGKRLEDVLRKEYNIELEMSDRYYGVALTSLADEEEDLIALKNALIEIALSRSGCTEAGRDSIRMVIPQKRYDLREAFYMNKENVEIGKSEGRISASMIVPYPPGIPLIVPGEKITEELRIYINELLEKGIKIQGIDEGTVQVLKS